MTIWVEYDDHFDAWEVSQTGGMGTLVTRNSRSAAIKAARRYRERGEDIAVKGPRMRDFKKVS